jgi:hypothetical protein
MTWHVPAAFPGGSVVVMASGPSMSAAVAAKVRASGVPAIAVNTTFLLAPWAWMLYAADWRWWHEHPLALQFEGLKATADIAVPPVHRLRNTGIDGFDPDPGCVRTGNNSGYQAVHIAIHTGAARVLLTGFDMRGGHWHALKDGPLRRDWIAHFATLAEAVRGRVEIINCTPASALTCFPRQTLDEALYADQARGLRGIAAQAP